METSLSICGNSFSILVDTRRYEAPTSVVETSPLVQTRRKKNAAIDKEANPTSLLLMVIPGLNSSPLTDKAN